MVVALGGQVIPSGVLTQALMDFLSDVLIQDRTRIDGITLIQIEKNAADILVTIPIGIAVVLRGAAILATVAQPPVCADDPRTLEVFYALGRLAADAFLTIDPSAANTELPWPAGSLIMPLSHARRVERRYKQKLEQRMGAANAFAPFVTSVLASVSGRGVRRRRAPTVDRAVGEAIELELQRIDAFKALGQDTKPRFSISPENFEHRVLRESLPVIHICIGIAHAVARSVEMVADWPKDRTRDLPQGVDARTGMWRPQFDADHIIFHEASQDIILEYAEIFEPVVELADLKSSRGWVRIREA
jgi:hypothetical protein